MGKSTESIFAEHLAASLAEEDEERAFAALLDQHPEHAEELRGLHAARKRAGSGNPPTFSEKTTSLHRPVGPKERAKSAFHATEGATIGDFRLVRLLGRGGMGEVWEAEQASLSRKVALKLMLPDRVNERGLDFFAREARAGGRLAHPGIVTVFGAGEDGGTHWIAMELVVGACDLRRSLDVMRDEAEVPEGYYEDIGGFIADLADALEIAHKAGVIHRDLKPANILVTADDTPKVSDFGLAKLEDEMSISSAGELLGTYYYMSPEQVATKRAGIDHRTDIFSLGVVMYEMLTLARPFEGDTTEQVAKKILWEEAPNPKEVRSLVPLDLSVICGKAMEKDPGRRYQTMAEFAEDLRRTQANETILAKPPTATQRAAKWARRNPVKAVAGSIAATAFVVVSWLLTDNMEKRADLTEALSVAKAARETADEATGQVKEDIVVMGEILDFLVGLFEVSGQGEERDGAERQREMLARGAAWLEEGLESQPMIRARLQGAIGSIYSSMGAYKEAEPMLEGTLKTYRAAFGDRDKSTLIAMYNLANLFARQGRRGEAEALFSEVLEVRRQSLGDEHPGTLAAMNNLAAVLVDQGRDDEAEPLYLDVLEARLRLLGEGDKDTLRVQIGLGDLYRGQGRYDEAEALYEAATEKATASLGAHDAMTLDAKAGLAWAHQTKGDYETAETLHREVLEHRRVILGGDHPHTLSAMSSVAVLCDLLVRYEEAEPLHIEVLTRRRELFGEQYPDTLNALHRLGIHYQRKGENDKAEAAFLEVIGKRRELLGDDHRDTLNSELCLSAIYQKQRRYEESEQLNLKVLETERRRLGENHPRTLSTKNNLALLYERQGRLEEAEDLLLEALAGAKRVFGGENPSALLYSANLAIVYGRQGRAEEAKALLFEVLGTWEGALAADHPHMKRALAAANGVAWGLVNPDRADRASDVGLGLTLARRATESAPKDAGKLDTLAWALFANGEHAEAISTATRAIQLCGEAEKENYESFLARLQGLIKEGGG